MPQQSPIAALDERELNPTRDLDDPEVSQTHDLDDPEVSQTHDLDRSELRELVSRLAADRRRWQPLVRFDAAGRHFEQLWRDDHIDIWVISWVNGNDTGFHDHDISHGAVAVVEGEVVEERLTLGGLPRRLTHKARDVFDFDASHVHRMRQDSNDRAVTIHAYSPPLRRMGTYAISPDGELSRRSISYAEELRADEVSAAFD
jgi:predicted metal-dependent enzyme (double-stranded beta helix superfamily)